MPDFHVNEVLRAGEGGLGGLYLPLAPWGPLSYLPLIADVAH